MNCINSTKHLILWIILSSSFIISIPICIWSVHRIYKSIKRSDAFMMARKPILSFTLLCLNLVDISIIQPLYCALFLMYGTQHYYTTINNIITDIRFSVFGLFFVSRMYILHFDHEYSRQCVNLLWTRDNDSFYIKHRKTYGKTRNVIRVTLILCILYFIIFTLPYFIDIFSIHFIDSYINMSLFGIEAVILFVFYCKINRIDDKFGIKKEILLITLCPGLSALCYYVMFAILRYTDILNISQCDEHFIYSFFMLFIMETTIMIKTVIPMQFRGNEEHKHTIRLMQIGDKKNAVCFEDVLGSRSALLLFVEHIESELSIENILFLVETAKFREHYLSKIASNTKYQIILKSKPYSASNVAKTQKKRNPMPYSLLIDYETVREYIRTDFDLDRNIQHFVAPLTASFIPIPMEYNKCTVREAAMHIFEHFITDDSLHCINISYSCRSKIKKLIGKPFHDEELSTIFLFDQAFHEIYVTILSDTFLRFKTSRKFINFIKDGRLSNISTDTPTESSHNSFINVYSDLRLSLQQKQTKTENSNVISTRKDLELYPIKSVGVPPMDHSP